MLMLMLSIGGDNITLLLGTALLVVIWPLVVGIVIKYWWRPWTIYHALQKQGFNGPPPRFMIGNLLDMANMVQHEMARDMPSIHHDFHSRVFPYFLHWSNTYGERFVIWFGYEPRIVAKDPHVIKQLLSSKHLDECGRSPLVQKMLSVAFGKGLVTVHGLKWHQQRRIVAPAFRTEKLKELVEIMAVCTREMVDDWNNIVIKEKVTEMELTAQTDRVTANIFVRTEFGMDYSEGMDVFKDIRRLEHLMIQNFRYLWLPGSRFLPTSTNIEIWRRNRRVERNLKRMIEERRERGCHGNDILGLMISEIDSVSAHDRSFRYTIQQLMDECKTFFLAGRETTSALLSWAFLLLALHPDWQQRARQEAITVCGHSDPTPESLPKLKIIGMIIHETLRLYPPASGIIRQAFKDLQIGENMVIPKGVNVIVDILAIHRDPELWGSDANEFRPERFKDGIAKASNHPLAFIPFSSGPRVCIGQNFAMLEAKVVMSIILKTYKFSVSSSYRHAPVSFVTLNPQHGIPIMIERLNP
eukprot:Gb_28075 [translate_table: standard]